MARPLVPDELWEVVEPLLPRHKARPGKRGRPPVGDRACLTGILFVLQSGIPWWMLPREMGCGSGVACWRRLRDWQRRGVWKRLLHALLDRLGREGLIDWSRAVVDSQSYRAVLGGGSPARTPRTGRKRARSGTSWSTAGARRWRSGSPAPGATNRPRRSRCSTRCRRSVSRAAAAAASRGPCTATDSTGSRGYQRELRRRGIEDHLARQRVPRGSGLGRIRWAVERTVSWVGQARGLKIRYDRLPAIHRAFHYLQLARICCKILQRDY